MAGSFAALCFTIGASRILCTWPFAGLLDGIPRSTRTCRLRCIPTLPSSHADPGEASDGRHLSNKTLCVRWPPSQTVTASFSRYRGRPRHWTPTWLRRAWLSARRKLGYTFNEASVFVSQGQQSTRSGDRGAHLRCSDAGLARFWGRPTRAHFCAGALTDALVRDTYRWA